MNHCLWTASCRSHHHHHVYQQDHHDPDDHDDHQVYHHGTLPVDYLYLVADTYLRTGRLIHSIVDRTLLLVPTNIFSREDKPMFGQVPGLGSIAYLMRCSAPSREKATALLAAGNIVGVAPGGGRQVVNKQKRKTTATNKNKTNKQT